MFRRDQIQSGKLRPQSEASVTRRNFKQLFILSLAFSQQSTGKKILKANKTANCMSLFSCRSLPFIDKRVSHTRWLVLEAKF